MARLEDWFRRLLDFSSDLAHELRTPISNLMTHTQVTVSRTRSADEYREVLYSNLEEYERLARMISDMLFLAKADNELITPGREKVDLATQVNELFGFYEPLAEERGVVLRLVGKGRHRGRPTDDSPGDQQPAVERNSAHAAQGGDQSAHRAT